MAISNIVFDIGNVVVDWDPDTIVRDAFDQPRLAEPGFRSPLAGNPLWLALNRGEHTMEEAKRLYIDEQGFEAAEIDRLYEVLFASLVPIEDTVRLMRDLAAAGLRLFAITDNVLEIVAHQRATHDFWDMFEAAAISAELGILKPDPRIYRHLLEAASLQPGESLFFDDVAANVEGAEAVGMHARVFAGAERARADLTSLAVSF
ncbi:HAD family hydrolase [Qipengyuania sp.]|uniref:HAD family hydrolase n=1 Tax=Qipengyuania sp. TaxID=2004515 RepID=UPI003AF50B64